MPKPIDAYGDPGAIFCRWCDEPRGLIRGAMFCRRCDSGDIGGVPRQSTWQSA